MTIDEAMKIKIKEYLTKLFYIEGKKEDYFFGESPLNNGLTVYYNNPRMKIIISSAISNALDTLYREAGLTRINSDILNFADSAFGIPVRTETHTLQQEDNTYLKCTINYMEPGVLEKAIKENPKRWQLYLDSCKKNEEN